MVNLLRKEIKLSASLLTFFFIAFGLIVFFPGYPILLSAFFISFGIFQSFQNAREANDILYLALLPIAKKDVVKAKFIFVSFIEMCGFVLIMVVTLLRMIVMVNVEVYRNNALMNANFVFLGFALVIFALFNIIFVRGFFKTAYYFAKSFIFFIIATFVVIGIGEALHYIPGFGALNSFGFDNIGLQLVVLAVGIVIYIVLTLIAYKASIKYFEEVDL